MKRKHLPEFDFIRAIVAMAVIAIHVTADSASKNNVVLVCNQLVRFAVPMFILVSGFLLYFADQNKKALPVRVFLKKRFSKIVIPYALWHTIYSLYVVYKTGQPAAAILGRPFIHSFITGFFFGRGYSHLYFLPLILQLYLLYPLLWRWMQRRPGTVVAASALLTLASQTKIYLHQLGIITLPPIGVPYVILFPLWLFFFVLGMYMAANHEKLASLYKNHGLLIAVLWLGSLVLLVLDSKWTQTFSLSSKPTVLLYTCTSFAFLQTMYNCLHKRIKPLDMVSQWLSRHSFFIFFSHFLIIDRLYRVLIYFDRVALMNHIEGVALFYTATVLLTVVLAWLCSHMPGIAFLGGYPGHPRKTT